MPLSTSCQIWGDIVEEQDMDKCLSVADPGSADTLNGI